MAGQGDAYIAAGVEWVSRYNERTEPAGAADRNPNLIGENGQDFLKVVAAKRIARREWQLEGRAFDVIDQDVQVVGIDHRVFG